MISLISVWNLKKGCPPELEEEIKILAGKVKKAEADTLMYEVNLQAPFPTDSNFNPLVPPPDPIPLNKQKNITFIEVYKNVEAFSKHVQGEVFTKFRVEFLKYFEEDPTQPGWPVTETTFLDEQSGFIRNLLAD